MSGIRSSRMNSLRKYLLKYLRKYLLPRVQSSTQRNSQQFCLVELNFENEKVYIVQ